MSKKQIAGMVVGGILLLAGGFWLGGRGGSPAEVSENVAGAVEKAETVWTCSMHPQIRQPHPGSCPICGMDLIPLVEDDSGEDTGDLPRLVLSERSVALMNVRVWPAERRAVEREVRLAGVVAFDERRLATISARVPGRLERLFVAFTGAEIGAGEPMVEIFSPELISAQEEFLQAVRAGKSSGRGDWTGLAEAGRGRLLNLGMSEEQVAELAARDRVFDRLTIHAPIGGTVVERRAKAGLEVERGEPLYAIADLSEVWVNLEAHATDLPWLRVGQEVSFSTPSHPGREFSGEIEFIDPVLDAGGRTARVRFSVLNGEGLLKPGMFVRAVVSSGGGFSEEPLIIPATAPLITGKRSLVYVKDRQAEKPAFEAREVALGLKAGDFYVVEEGLEEGELVVVHGAFKIDSELQIRGRPSMMSPAETVEETETAGVLEVTRTVLEEVDPGFAEDAVRLIRDYLGVVEGLAEDDLGKVRSGLLSMREGLGRFDGSLLSEDVRRFWEERAGKLGAILERLGEGAELGEVRGELGELTAEVEQVHLNFAGDLALHRAYCPMAEDNVGGIWFQTGSEINNPYFGASMLRCGELVETVGKE